MFNPSFNFARNCAYGAYVHFWNNYNYRDVQAFGLANPHNLSIGDKMKFLIDFLKELKKTNGGVENKTTAYYNGLEVLGFYDSELEEYFLRISLKEGGRACLMTMYKNGSFENVAKGIIDNFESQNLKFKNGRYLIERLKGTYVEKAEND